MLQTLEQLLEENQGLIYSQVNRFNMIPKYTVFEYEDLVQEATLAFIEAYHTFDPTLNIKFTTYATTCIKNKLALFSIQRANTFKFSPSFAKVWQAIRKYDLSTNDVESISKLTNLPPKTVIEAIKWQDAKYADSYDAMEDATNLQGVYEDDLTEIIVQEFLSTLDDDTKTIVILRMDGYTHQSICEVIKVSRKTIGNILSRTSNQWESQNA